MTRSDERVRLMVDLAARHGLRRSELAVVNTDDMLRIGDGWSLVVHGKGGKDRLVPLQADTAAAMRRRGPGWVFPGLTDGHLGVDRVGRLVADALPGIWTAHTLRHRYGTKVWHGSHDIVALQELMGHASITTTRIYVQEDQAAMRAAAQWAA